MRKYKKPGYAAAYKRLRFAQEAQAAKGYNSFAWIAQCFLYLLIAFGPIIYFQLLSFFANAYFGK